MNHLDSRVRHFFGGFAQKEGAIGLMALANPFLSLPLLKNTDWLLLMVRDQVAPYDEVEHMQWEQYRLQVRRVTPETLDHWVYGGDRSGVQWLLQGEIISDEKGCLGHLRRMLQERPALLREQRLLCEFSRFFHNYALAKSELQEGRVVDAYCHALKSLLHWAQITLVEQDVLPEIAVLEQMRCANPDIFKLYEELTSSPETLEQRVQLVILACEFSVLIKLKSCCRLLLRVLEDRDEPATIEQLHGDHRLRPLPIDMPMLLHKLVHRGLVREVAAPAKDESGVMLEIRYAPASV